MTIAGIYLDGLPEKPRCLRQAIQIIPTQCVAPQHTLISSETARRFAPRSRDVGYLDTAHEGTDDRLHNLVLYGEKLPQFPIKFFGPYMTTGLGIDQLRVDTYALAYSPDAAFDDKADVQLPTDLLDVYCCIPVLERSQTGPHRKKTPTRQFGNDVFRNSVAEILLFRVAAHIAERQHADGDTSGFHRGWCRGGRSGIGGQRAHTRPGAPLWERLDRHRIGR